MTGSISAAGHSQPELGILREIPSQAQDDKLVAKFKKTPALRFPLGGGNDLNN